VFNCFSYYIFLTAVNLNHPPVTYSTASLTRRLSSSRLDDRSHSDPASRHEVPPSKNLADSVGRRQTSPPTSDNGTKDTRSTAMASGICSPTSRISNNNELSSSVWDWSLGGETRVRDEVRDRSRKKVSNGDSFHHSTVRANLPHAVAPSGAKQSLKSSMPSDVVSNLESMSLRGGNAEDASECGRRTETWGAKPTNQWRDRKLKLDERKNSSSDVHISDFIPVSVSECYL